MSTYIDSVINANENVEYQARVSPWSLLPLLMLGLLTLPLFGVGLVFWAIAALRYWTTELAITNKRIIAKFGFIRRATVELLLPKAESVQVDQSILGRLFNYGSVLVSGAGIPQAPVPGISDPLVFRRKFMEVQERSMAPAVR